MDSETEYNWKINNTYLNSFNVNCIINCINFGVSLSLLKFLLSYISLRKARCNYQNIITVSLRMPLLLISCCNIYINGFMKFINRKFEVISNIYIEYCFLLLMYF